MLQVSLICCQTSATKPIYWKILEGLVNNAPAIVYKYSELTEDFPSGQNFPDHLFHHQNFTSPKLSHVCIVIQVSILVEIMGSL